jgi:hypothetical protein
MKASTHLRWLGAVLLVGVVYLVAGLLFASLARSATSNQMRDAWRLAAWAVSAAAFGAHIGYEQLRLRSSPVMTAFHAALAVGLGAFLLAVAASLHARTAATSHHFPAIALVIWPVVTALPAFVAAFAVTILLARTRRSV